jgi:hypothetical protein
LPLCCTTTTPLAATATYWPSKVCNFSGPLQLWPSCSGFGEHRRIKGAEHDPAALSRKEVWTILQLQLCRRSKTRRGSRPCMQVLVELWAAVPGVELSDIILCLYLCVPPIQTAAAACIMSKLTPGVLRERPTPFQDLVESATSFHSHLFPVPRHLWILA